MTKEIYYFENHALKAAKSYENATIERSSCEPVCYDYGNDSSAHMLRHGTSGETGCFNVYQGGEQVAQIAFWVSNGNQDLEDIRDYVDYYDLSDDFPSDLDEVVADHILLLDDDKVAMNTWGSVLDIDGRITSSAGDIQDGSDKGLLYEIERKASQSFIDELMLNLFKGSLVETDGKVTLVTTREEAREIFDLVKDSQASNCIHPGDPMFAHSCERLDLDPEANKVRQIIAFRDLRSVTRLLCLDGFWRYTHGGARKGAGRKLRGSAPRVTVSARVDAETARKIALMKKGGWDLGAAIDTMVDNIAE